MGPKLLPTRKRKWPILLHAALRVKKFMCCPYWREILICRYASHSALLGIELLNEPSAATVPLDTLVSYYKQGYQIVRKHSSTAYVIMCQRIGIADPLELYQANIGSRNIVLDLHYYNLFDTFFVNMSVSDNIHYIYTSRDGQLKALNSSNSPLVFIGKTTLPTIFIDY